MTTYQAKKAVTNTYKNGTAHHRASGGPSYGREMALTSGGALNAFYSAGPIVDLGSPGIVQKKLTIGRPNDRFEQEADRVADRVMRMPDPQPALVQREPGRVDCRTEVGEEIQTKPLAAQITPLVQRQTEDEEEPIETKTIQRQEDEEEPIETKTIQPREDDNGELIQGKRKSVGPIEVKPGVQRQIQSLRGGGRPLPQAERSFFESRFGSDFSRVRLHTDSHTAGIAGSLNANAFTIGTDVAFGAGQYSPGTASGKRLLAHELTHVVQQTGMKPLRSAAKTTGGGSNPLAGISRHPVSTQPMIQRDLAIRPPRPNAVGRTLSKADMKAAIAYNKKYLSSIPNSAAVIEMIRDVLGTSPTPAVVDADFVTVVVDWQAMYRLRQDGKLGPRTARPLFRELGAEKEGEGKVKTGPKYRPQVPAVNNAGGRKSTTFRLNAEFVSDPAKKFYPSCCEVRQYIKWDAAAAASFAAIRGKGKTVPHNGFPAAHPANSWIEDRNAGNTLRYGHRIGFSPSAGNQYLDSGGNRNQAFGHIYRGRDSPGGPATLAGRWWFLIKVIDVCRGRRTIGTQDVIRINW